MSIKLKRAAEAREAPAAVSEPPRSLPAPLSPARQRLAEAIGLLNVAVAELGESQRPADRLGGTMRQWEEAARALNELREGDDAVLATWLAEGAEGPRPEPSEERLAAERRAAQCLHDAEAARKALPAVQARYDRCAEMARSLSRDRDAALAEVALEVARGLAEKVTAALNAGLEIEARMLSIADELARRGRGDDGSAFRGAAEKIRYAAHVAKRLAAARTESETGVRLIEALMTDPAATV